MKLDTKLETEKLINELNKQRRLSDIVSGLLLFAMGFNTAYLIYSITQALV